MKSKGYGGKRSSRVKQKGFSALLLTLLTGISVAGMTMGLVYSINSSQSSVVAIHAQTEAQIRAAAAYQALAAFLSNKNFDSVSDINEISGGSISAVDNNAVYNNSSVDCPLSANSTVTPNICFDVVAESGDAAAIVRAIFKSTRGVKTGTQSGSVFAGGLVVGGSASFTGDNNSTIYVKDDIVTDTAGNEVTLTGIDVELYVPTDFVAAEDLLPFANYIFRADAAVAGLGYSIEKKNLGGDVSVSTSGITYSAADNLWTIDLAVAVLPPGVLWFDGNLVISPPARTRDIPSGQDLRYVNSFIAKGSLELAVATSSSLVYDFYAPAEFYNQPRTGDVPVGEFSVSESDAYAEACGTNASQLPTQYCHNSGLYDPNIKEGAAVANIVFFSGGELSVGSGNNATVAVHGNLIASTGAGGTGMASGKFTGTGTIKVEGNIVISGETDVTEMLGNIDISLSKTTGSGNVIPMPTYKITPVGYRYL